MSTGPEDPGAGAATWPGLQRPILVLEHVHARDAAGPGGRARGAITGVSLALAAGVHVVLGAPEDGTLALLDAVTGARAPLRGKIRVNGADPRGAPRLRARIGALAPEARLPSAPSVGAAIRLALRARGEDGHRFDAVLDPLGLSSLHARKLPSLRFAEARAVELALALTTPAPLVVALHEPLSDVAVPNLHLVQSRLRELAEARACVLITTSSPADARDLADTIHVLRRGAVVRSERGDGGGLAPYGRAELTAWIARGNDDGDGDGSAAQGARALAAALTRAPHARGVTWEAEPSGVALVRIQADTIEACSAALIDATVETGITLAAIARSAPDLGQVRAATDTLLRMRWAADRPTAPFHPPSMPAARNSSPSTLPMPSVRSPVEDGGPLGRPKSFPPPPENAGPHAVPMLPGPPALPDIPMPAAASSRPPRAPSAPPGTDKGER